MISRSGLRRSSPRPAPTARSAGRCIPLDGKEPRSAPLADDATPEAPSTPPASGREWGKRWNMGVAARPLRARRGRARHAEAHETLLELLGGELPADADRRRAAARACTCTSPTAASRPATPGRARAPRGRQQCVLPPSVHPETGRPYQWADGHEPWTAPLSPSPRRRSRTSTPARRSGRRRRSATRSAEGERHRTLLSLAGTHAPPRHERRRDRRRAARASNERRCKPPLPERGGRRARARRRPPLRAGAARPGAGAARAAGASELLERGDAPEPVEPRRAQRRQTAPLIVSLVEFLGGNEDDAAWLVDHLAARGALVRRRRPAEGRQVDVRLRAARRADERGRPVRRPAGRVDVRRC